MKLSNIQVLVLRLVLGVLFLSEGVGKISEGWLINDQPLLQSLNGFHQRAAGPQLVYLDHIAIPHVNVWSKLMAIGETAVGTSMLLGLLVRCSSLAGIFMVLNFHAANGNLYSLKFFGSAWGALIVVSFLVVFLAGAGRWLGADAMLAKRNPKGMLW